MGVKGRDLVHLGHGQPHLGRERLQVSSIQATVFVLHEVQVFDQQVTVARPVDKQCRNLVLRGWLELPSLVKCRRPPASRARGYAVLTRVVLAGIRHRGAVLSVTLSMDRKDTSREPAKKGTVT